MSNEFDRPLEDIAGMDFSARPKSITEIKSDKSSRGSDWTPRDLLISVLRDIDGGVLKPDVIVLAYRETNPEDPGAHHTGFFQASPDVFTAMGVLLRTLLRLGNP